MYINPFPTCMAANYPGVLPPPRVHGLHSGLHSAVHDSVHDSVYDSEYDSVSPLSHAMTSEGVLKASMNPAQQLTKIERAHQAGRPKALKTKPDIVFSNHNDG